MDNPQSQPMAPKPAMKSSGKNPMFGVMPIAVMAFALVAFIFLVFWSVSK